MTLDEYLVLREKVIAFDPEIIDRSKAIRAPDNAVELSLRAAFVIINASLRATVASRLWPAVRHELLTKEAIAQTFRHPRKRAAINAIFEDRHTIFETFARAATAGPASVIAFCETLPGVGRITKFHLAKNLGVDCAKPDIWLQRVAERSGEDVEALCERLAALSGDQVRVVDTVIWRACERGWWRDGGIEP